MADPGLPDTLTPEQAQRLGFLPKPGGKLDLPDALTPEQAQRLGMATPDSVAEAERVAAENPGVFERMGRGFGAMAHTIGAGGKTLFGHSPLLAAISAPEGERLKAAGGAFVDSMKDVTDPARRREVERGVDNMVTLGYGQRIADAADKALFPPTAADVIAGRHRAFSPEQAAADQAAAPGYREAGTLVGIGSPGVVSSVGKGAGKVVQVATAAAKPTSIAGRAALGTGRAIAGYELSAPALAAASADSEGRRLEAAREAASDPAGLVIAGLTGGASGAAQRTIETAPARGAKRQAKDITTGEQNAGIKITRKVQERAGEGGERLAAVLAEDPKLEKLVAVKAGTSPGKVVKAVTAKIGDVNDELDAIYAEMEKAGRVVAPADIDASFTRMIGERMASGDQPAVNLLKTARQQFRSTYGNYGKLSADTLRGLKSTAGTAAFSRDPNLPATVKTQVSRDIWRVYADAIEAQAKGTKGVDVDRLRKLNQDVSVLIPAEQALAERATSAAAGRRSIAEHIGRATLAGAGFAHGGAKEAVVGLLAPEIIKMGQQGVRRVDYRLAKRFGGISPETAGAAGGRTGSAEYAARVAQGMGGGKSLQEAIDAADAEER